MLRCLAREAVVVGRRREGAHVGRMTWSEEVKKLTSNSSQLQCTLS